jgi:hypothetical protein
MDHTNNIPLDSINKESDPDSINKELDLDKELDFNSDDDINEAIIQSKVKNTESSTQQWMRTFDKFRAQKKYNQPLASLDNNALQYQLSKFIVGVKKLDKTDYTPASLVVGFSAIARGIREILAPIRHINIHDKNQWYTLHQALDGQVKKLQNVGLSRKKKPDYLTMDEIKILLNSTATSIHTAKGLMQRTWLWLSLLLSFRGGDGKRLKFKWVEVRTDSSIKVNLPVEKNNAGGVKNLHNNGRENLIPPDDPKNEYTPIADILKFISMRPQNAQCEMFFLALEIPKRM